MALSRREFEVLRDRVSKLEQMIRGLEDKLRVQENRVKGDNLLRAIHEAEEQEKARKERESMLP